MANQYALWTILHCLTTVFLLEICFWRLTMVGDLAEGNCPMPPRSASVFLNQLSNWVCERKLEQPVVIYEELTKLEAKYCIRFWQVCFGAKSEKCNFILKLCKAVRGAEDRACSRSRIWNVKQSLWKKMKASEMLCKFRERSKCWSWFEVVLSKRRVLSCIRGQLLE